MNTDAEHTDAERTAAKHTDADTRRALARLLRAIEKARREVRGLRAALEQSEADGFPGDDYAAMDSHLVSALDLVKSEQTRQQLKILRSGGIAPGRLEAGGSATLRSEAT